MCLAVPGKIMSLEGNKAVVDMLGNQTNVDVSVLPEVAIGDYILVHAGCGIQKYDEQEAKESLELIKLMIEKVGNVAI